MSSLIIRPRGDHSLNQSTQGSLDHYQNIDEETLNEADYNYYTNANDSKTDVYYFGKPTSDAGVRAQAINSVTLKIQAKKVINGTDTTEIQIGLLVRVSDINYTQNVTPTTSTSELSYSWALNPNTGSAWTWTQLDNILAGDTINAHYIDKNNYCGSQVYQMWIVVTYGEEEGQTLTLDLSDTVNLSDAIAKAVGLNKADTANLSDARVKDIGLAKADTANISDAPAKAFSIGEIADMINITDAIIKEAGLNKADTFYVSDADDGSGTLGITKAIGLNKADTVNISDAIIKDMGKAFADEVSLSDLIDLVLNGEGTALELSLDDTVYFSDGIIKLYEKPLRDEVEFSDALAKAFSMGEIADGVDISDAIVKDVSKGIIADTVNISDEISKEAELNKADNIEIEDALTTKDIGLNKADTVNISDSIVKDMSKAFDDVVYISDLIDVVLSEVGEALELFLSDTVIFSDAIAKAYEKPLQDEVEISDALAKEFGKVVSDIIEFSDSIAKSIDLALSDTTLLSDSVARHLGKTLADGITAADQIRKAIGKVLQNTVYISDVCLTLAITAETYKSMVIALQRVREVCGRINKRVKEVTLEARIREVVRIPVHLKKEVDMDILVFDPKQSWEEYYVAFNFARVITPLTTIQSTTILVYDEAGTEVSETFTDNTKTQITRTKVFVWVRGGSEQTYKITCRIIMSNGEKFEQDATLEVTEV